jgi:hypothetical protein
MSQRFRHALKAVVLVAALGISSASVAALLGIGLQISDLPIVQFDGGTTVIAGGVFTASVTDGTMAIATTSGGSLVTDNSLTISAVLDSSCNLVGGIAGNDFELSGGIFGGATQILLTGEVLQFGFTEDPGNPVQEFDFRFAVTGGSLAGDFTDEDLGVVVTSLNSTFGGNCGVTSSGLAKGRLGPIPPVMPAEGCTPGYWKQKHHFDSWVGYAPSDSFAAVFGRSVSGVSDLQSALKAKGGGVNALARHATASLLNVASPDVYVVDYSSTAAVIAAFQAAYDGGDYEPTKDAFEEANEAGCPLN